MKDWLTILILIIGLVILEPARYTNVLLFCLVVQNLNKEGNNESPKHTHPGV